MRTELSTECALSPISYTEKEASKINEEIEKKYEELKGSLDRINKEELRNFAIKKYAHKSMHYIHSLYSQEIEEDIKKLIEVKPYLPYVSQKEDAAYFASRLKILLEKNNIAFCQEMAQEQQYKVQKKIEKLKLKLQRKYVLEVDSLKELLQQCIVKCSKEKN